jgi:glycosyltransferase involved in cell wall biosynthesis
MQDKSFLIVKHTLGSAYPGPAESLERFLQKRCRDLVVISHPLNRKSIQKSECKFYRNGILVSIKTKKRFLPYPIGRIFDPFVFRSLPVNFFNVAIGYNALSTFQCSMYKKLKRVETLAFWGVDYVPKDSRNWFIWRVETFLKTLSAKHINYQIELTERMINSRDLGGANAIKVINPIGLDTLDYIPDELHNSKVATNFVFLGGLNMRTGVEFCIELIEELKKEIPFVHLDIVGSGAIQSVLTSKVDQLNLHDNIKFHGFLPEGQELMNILQKASFGIAPFPKIASSFTYYADPQKIKRYFAAGCIVLTTNETEIAEKIQRDKLGLVFESCATSEEWAQEILEMLNDKPRCQEIRQASLVFSKNLDNELLFQRTVSTLLQDNLPREQVNEA